MNDTEYTFASEDTSPAKIKYIEEQTKKKPMMIQ